MQTTKYDTNLFEKPVHWNNQIIYKNFQDPQIQSDLAELKTIQQFLQQKSQIFSDLILKLDQTPASQLQETISLAQECYKKQYQGDLLTNALYVYSQSALTINSQDQDAKNLFSQVSALSNEVRKSSKSFQLFLLRSPDDFLKSFFQDSFVQQTEFQLRYNRQQNDYLLSVPEEVLAEGFSFDGLHSWGRLYSELAGSIKVQVDGQEMGMADATNWLYHSDSQKRHKAYQAINSAWKKNEISVSFILNSIYGWRIEDSKLRSSKKSLHYLDQSCHQSRITQNTLNALMDTTYKNRSVGQKALNLMAKEMGVKKLGPQDTLAGYPHSTTKISYNEAIEIVYEAFNEFSEDMGKFVRMCVAKSWIDATPTDNRGAGAYCTGFAKVRESRVFITYDGSMKNVMTLAHELGHAYHNWALREIPLGEARYPMTLAETASIFGETLVRQALLKKAKSNQQKKEILWQEIESAGSLLINIPARYEFEKQAMELRKKKSITAQDFSELTKNAWSLWYEDTLTENNEMFWASKMHFSFSHIGFYNYPYLFGYLFSLGIYAQKEKIGEKFVELYQNILKDTGKMTAEKLIEKHLNQDISKAPFWQSSIDIVSAAVNEYESL